MSQLTISEVIPSLVSVGHRTLLTIVRGKRRKDTVLICLSQDDVDEGKIALNKGTSTNMYNTDLQLPERIAPSRSETFVMSPPPTISNTVKGDSTLYIHMK